VTRIFSEGELIRRLIEVGRFEKTAFAAACAERLLPLFERYALKTGRDSLPLSQALAEVWRATAGGSEDYDLALQGQVAERLMPDEEDPAWVWESGYAQNAAASVAYAVRTWLTDDPQEAAWAARQVYEAADYAAQQPMTERDLNAPGTVQRLLENPIVQAAIEGIEADLALVEREGHIAVGALRERASREGSSWTAELH
jgi:Protein of unknown function (DUF416)